MPADQKPYRHRYSRSIIDHAIWLYHRYTLSFRDIEEMLLHRNIRVSYETIREWCLKFSDDFTKKLRKKEPQRGSKWHLDEVVVEIKGVKHWIWRAVDEGLTRAVEQELTLRVI